MLRRFKGDTFPSGTDSFKESYGIMGTFWLGLYNLYELTKSGNVTLRITYVQRGTVEEHSMEYAGFRILNNETFRSDYKVFKIIQGITFDKVQFDIFCVSSRKYIYILDKRRLTSTY